MTFKAFMAQTGTDRAWINHPAFAALYVRKPRHGRIVEGRAWPRVVDLASMDAKHPGTGAFTRLVKRIATEYPEMGVFVENVLVPRFARRLANMGFQCLGPPELPCFFLPPAAQARKQAHK